MVNTELTPSGEEFRACERNLVDKSLNHSRERGICVEVFSGVHCVSFCPYVIALSMVSIADNVVD